MVNRPMMNAPGLNINPLGTGAPKPNIQTDNTLSKDSKLDGNNQNQENDNPDK